MKKILLSAIAVTVGFSNNVLFAESKSLIDFNQYEQKLSAEPAFKQAGDQPATTNQTEALDTADINKFKVSTADMSLDNWLVSLNSSSKQLENIRYSYAKKVTTQGKIGGGPRVVLGARIHFPEWPNNSYAEIAPPYDFPTYREDGTMASNENGVLHNVGDIYSITAEVYGRNYKNALYLQLRNESGSLEKYFLGYLYFNGWRKLTWRNPAYIDNVNLKEIVRIPIFPDRGVPYKRLDSFMIFRQGYDVGGNFLFYVANVNMVYDLAVLEEEEDINEENTWQILSSRLKEEASIRSAARAELVELREQTLKKMAMVKVNGQDNAQPAGGQPAPAAAQPAA